MKGDFTTLTFDPKKHYSRVRMQQGRVQMDANWNEQMDILLHLDRTARRDVIGYCGGPLGQDGQGDDLAGFKISIQQNDLLITRGRYYVDGILCENDRDSLISEQPHLPAFALPEGFSEEGNFLAYLDVWERHITALDDPDIREVALGGPDTATRTQTIWQVKLEPVEAGVDCDSFGLDWAPAGTESTGRLAARAVPDPDGSDLCLTPENGGYRRLENQLYRVEIHLDGGINEATFKWSRENGSVVARWEDQDGDDLIVSSSGRDSKLGFGAGEWVELTGDTQVLNGKPGIMVPLANVEGRILTIDPSNIDDPDDPAATSVDQAQFLEPRKIRRWEVLDGAEVVRVPAANDGWLPLEDGVEVRFDPAGVYRTGDYWLIPARTAVGDVLWPKDQITRDPIPEVRQGIEHYYCPLALIGSQAAQERGLIKFTAGVAGPDLAELFEASEDSLRWSFNLVQEVSLPDGSPLVAPVIVEILTQDADNLTGFLNAEAIDDFSLVINLDPSIPTNTDRFLEELSEIRIGVGSQERQITDCRSLFPPLTQLAEPAIHVTEVVLGNNEPLLNDSDVPVAALVNGLQIRCDKTIDSGSVKAKPNCFVTLDMPFPLNTVERGTWGPDVIGFRPLKLAAEATSQDKVILLRFLGETSKWLQERLFQVLAETERGDRVLARLTLRGNFVWSLSTPRLYLDGDAFGQPARNNGRTDLRLPSGDGRTGGDFEMWFWLVGRETASPTIGLIPNLASPFFLEAENRNRLREAISGLINRRLIRDAGFGVDPDLPLDPPEDTSAIDTLIATLPEELRDRNLVIVVFDSDQSLLDLVQEVAKMLQDHGLNVIAIKEPFTEFDTLGAALNSGEAAMVLGGEELAKSLADLFPELVSVAEFIRF